MSINIGMSAVRMGKKTITKEQLDEVIKQHDLWLKDHSQGKRTELIGYSFGNRVDDVVRDKEEFDPSLLHDGEGIHFFLSRAEAERFEYKTDDDKEDSEEGDENDE